MVFRFDSRLIPELFHFIIIFQIHNLSVGSLEEVPKLKKPNLLLLLLDILQQ